MNERRNVQSLDSRVATAPGLRCGDVQNVYTSEFATRATDYGALGGTGSRQMLEIGNA